MPPRPEVIQKSYIKSPEERKEVYESSIQDPEKYWAEVAEGFHWQTSWNTVRKFNYNTNEGPIYTSWCAFFPPNEAAERKHIRVETNYEFTEQSENNLTLKRLLEDPNQHFDFDYEMKSLIVT